MRKTNLTVFMMLCAACVHRFALNRLQFHSISYPMKPLFLPLAFVAMFSLACANDKQSHSDETHVHDDGSMHENHADTTHHHQEEFEVGSDSTEVEHSHDDGSHSH